MSIRVSRTMLLALQHADSQFPSGGFAFSQGLEASARLTDRLGPFEFSSFLDVQLRHRWASADRVALTRAYRLRGDLDRLAELDLEVEASTFMEGLRVGSRRNGTALLTFHSRLGTAGASAYRELIRLRKAPGHVAVVQGLLWQALGLDEEAVVAIGGYQAAALLTTAGLRLGLIGAVEAQKLLGQAISIVCELSSLPVADDEPIRSFTPQSEIAVALHGSGGQRLFSN